MHNSFVKIGCVVPEICSPTDRHVHHNTPLRWQGMTFQSILLKAVGPKTATYVAVKYGTSQWKWLGETPFVQVSTTRALSCPETVHQRPRMMREIETWLSDSRVGNNSVVDYTEADQRNHNQNIEKTILFLVGSCGPISWLGLMLQHQ